MPNTARRGNKLVPGFMELSRKSTHAQLASYLQAKHELLAPLLPDDTSCHDLFEEVEIGGSIGEFMMVPSEMDAAVKRDLKRLGHQISAWLVEEKAQLKAQLKREKKDASRKAALERQKKKAKIFGEPPKPPTMAFEAAQAVASHAAAKRQEGARAQLLQNGWTGSFRTPSGSPPLHQQWFLEDRAAACKAMGCEYCGESYGVMKVYFPGAALEAFEEIKRATKTKVTGKGAAKVVTPMPYANWVLPTDGPALSWQEFFSFVGHIYNKSGAASVTLLLQNSAERIGEIGDQLAAELGQKYEVKIERECKNIAKVDKQMAEARDGKTKEQLAEQLQTLRATRDALIEKKIEEQEQLQRQYDAYKETKLIQEALAKAKKEKAANAHASLFTRTAPAGGATAADGAACIEALEKNAAAHKAAAELVARASSAVLTALGAAEESEAEDAMQVDELAADFEGF